MHKNTFASQEDTCIFYFTIFKGGRRYSGVPGGRKSIPRRLQKQGMRSYKDYVCFKG